MHKRNYTDTNNRKRNRNIAGAIPFLCLALIFCGCGKSAELVPIDGDSERNSVSEEAKQYDYKDAGNKYDNNESEDNTSINETQTEKSEPADYPDRYAAIEEETKCFVHVCGAVNVSGVYEIETGKHIVDAIMCAGGFAENANTDYINLAIPVADGMKVYVPTTDEVLAEENKGLSMADAPNSVYVETGIVQAGNAAGNPAEGSSVLISDAGTCLININTADAEALMTIPGIGQSKAAKILEYRDKNGPFGNISDIMNVDGIKNGMYDKIKDRICVN